MRSDSMYAAKLALFSLLLLLPLVLGSSDDGVDAHIQTFNSHSHSHPDSHPHPHSHMHDMDPAAVIFFLMEDLKLGNSMPIYFPNRDLSQSFPHLISKQEADSVPFSLQRLPDLLRLFSFSPDSPQAQAMEETLKKCERAPLEAEIKTCATSWESMTQFMHTIFGAGTPFKYVSTTHLKRSNPEEKGSVQRYTIMGIKQIPSPKMVGCHSVVYAYTVFFCHYQTDSQSRVYRVALKGENGDEVDAVAVCHLDTSHWAPTYVAFKILGVQPGPTPVCHFFPADHLVWVPAAAN